jgi:hypothetical protein
VVYRTAREGVAPLPVYRISELCGGPAGAPCEPDFLYDHDAGSLLADVDFITMTSIKPSNSSHGHHHHFIGDFNGSVITSYCVERRDEPFADYVSCNGPDPEHYSCACNNWIDRCIGRIDVSPCVGFDCHCSNASLATSAERIGRMPVYAPFPHVNHSSMGGDCHTPPPQRSSFLGSWYSFPSQAECPAGTPPTARAGRATADCSWARGTSQIFVHGWQLLERGFNRSDVLDIAQLEQNRGVIAAAFASHPTRCCGC